MGAIFRRESGMKSNQVLGIIGGMGPLATAKFFEKLVKLVPAEKDQDHPRILIDSNPKIPDRTDAIFGNGPSPIPAIIKTAFSLKNCGAGFLAIPCVTAHYYYEEIQKAVDIPIVHMIRETAERYISDFAEKRAGLLATNGTLRAEIFQNFFPPTSLIVPDQDTQTDFVMKAIYGVKSGELAGSKTLILKAYEKLISSGAELIIAGCTEVPIILNSEDISIPLLDPLTVLAEVCVERMLNLK